jgi:Tol biopolymer transport system component
VLRGGGGNSADPATGEPAPIPRAQVGPARPGKNGEVTILDYRQDASTVRAGGGRRDWYGLSTIDRNGELQPLVRCPGRREWCGWVVSADWSPDGRHLAVSVTTLKTPNPNGIHIIDVTTGVDRHIGQAIEARDLDWSPDGRLLAYAERGVIKVIDLTRARPLPKIVAKGASPSWSPDGAWIAYATGRFLRGTATPSRVEIVRPDGTGKHSVVPGGAAPAWSPLGDVIAYRSNCGINLVTPDGRDATPPSPLRCNAIGVRGTPVWSPDGKKIAIGASPTRPGLPYGTFVMNADGSNLVRLTGSVHTTEGFAQPRPTWRPLP